VPCEVHIYYDKQQAISQAPTAVHMG